MDNWGITRISPEKRGFSPGFTEKKPLFQRQSPVFDEILHNPPQTVDNGDNPKKAPTGRCGYENRGRTAIRSQSVIEPSPLSTQTGDNCKSRRFRADEPDHRKKAADESAAFKHHLNRQFQKEERGKERMEDCIWKRDRRIRNRERQGKRRLCGCMEIRLDREPKEEQNEQRREYCAENIQIIK